MIVTVDIGNSRIKCALWEKDDIIDRAASDCHPDAGPLVFDRLFSSLGKLTGQKPSQVFAVSVAGDEWSQALARWIRQHWQLEVAWLKTERQYKNIVNAYADPAEHGVDRWAAVVAGHLACPGSSVIVIGAGTAITFDLVDRSGRHLGGYILPSYESMHAALLASTSRVVSSPEEYMLLQNNNVPDNTSDAVNRGLHVLLQAGIREFCRIARVKMGSPMQILLTGGYASTILSYPEMPDIQHSPDLVMQGVYEIMKQHRVECAR